MKRNPGDRWMINGPTDYVPPIEVSILESRSLPYLVLIAYSTYKLHHISEKQCP